MCSNVTTTTTTTTTAGIITAASLFFLSVKTDGTPKGKKSLRDINADGLGQLSALSSTINKESIKVLSKTLVPCTYFATMEFNLKTADKKITKIHQIFILTKYWAFAYFYNLHLFFKFNFIN